MGSWDCFCAICGGPLVAPAVSRKPRSARFLDRWARKAEQRRERGLPDDASVHSDTDGSDGEQDDDDDDAESLGAGEEDGEYDPEIISEEQVGWTETLYVLGLNPEASGTSKAFVAGPGQYLEFSLVTIDESSDPNADGVDIGNLQCYCSWESEEPVFPFHWCCYEILAKHLTGSFDVGKLDKDLVYSIMRDLTVDYGKVLRDTDYGDASWMHEEYWRVSPGYEYLVSHPRDVPGAKETMLSLLGSSKFEKLSSEIDPGQRVRSDPFMKLPYDLICGVTSMLEDRDLLNLMSASWPVHGLLRNTRQFWQQRLKTSIPWFFELHELLEHDQTLLQAIDPKRILLWAERMIRPKRWITGPFLGVANRRRIWYVCEQLGERYFPRSGLEDPRQSYVEQMIMAYSNCSSFVVTSAPEATEADVLRNVYWFKSWWELPSKQKEFSTFWDGPSLAGISLGVARGTRELERQLLGRDNTTEGVYGDFVRLQEDEWITGLILHIPTIDIGASKRQKLHMSTIDEVARVATSVEGLTVILNTGEKKVFGTTNRGYPQRYLPVAPDWYLTGMTAKTGEVDGKQQFTRLGLLQAQLPDKGDYSVLPEPDAPPRPTPLQALLWDEDYSGMLQLSIWDHPTLELVYETDHSTGFEDGVHRDLIPHQALIWARDQQDLRSLRRVSGFVVVTGARLGGETPTQDVCGVSAEYDPKSALMRRMIGITKSSPGAELKFEDPWRHFEIDGPGGEVITEVQYAMTQEKPKPMAMKIRTSRGRECCWGEVGSHNWQTLRAPPGETLVGLVVAFSEPSGYDNGSETRYTHCKMGSVAALSMPLGIPEGS